jgi:ubiquinone/menaquinone biosynthesis C-methylase UbiE
LPFGAEPRELVCMVDPIFSNPRLAAIYDVLDGARNDLDFYEAIVEELGANSVLDLGCGTGTFACRLARKDFAVVGVDPADASLVVARTKPGAGDVRWIKGDAFSLPADLDIDLVTMTGNVAQVFLSDSDWAGALSALYTATGPGGLLVFEARDPADAAWTGWTRSASWRTTEIDEVGIVESWVELTAVNPPLVSFRWTFVFHRDKAVIKSDSTLRFRTRAQIAHSLTKAGYVLDDVRDAPDRPSREMVFVASRPHL